MSSSLFDKILINNQIINGKLNVDERILKKVYNSLNKNFERLESKKNKQEQLIKANIKSLNNLKAQIKKNLESYNKAFKPSINKISLLYKKVGEIFYIKARFYWHGKQREVQIGTISSVISIINKLIKKKILKSLAPLNNNKLKWESILANPQLINAIKEIASIKSQEYILRKLMQDDPLLLRSIENKKNNQDFVNINQESTDEDTTDIYVASDLDEGESWYDRWRKENL
tara:strand:- start:198 stop:887 length:690 start_codon:yes stop_codon:yes gene_type:complete